MSYLDNDYIGKNKNVGLKVEWNIGTVFVG